MSIWRSPYTLDELNGAAVSKSGGSAVEYIVDSGTTLNYVPTSVADAINAAFSPAATYSSSEGAYVVSCTAKAPAVNVSGKVFNVATGRRTTLLEAYEEVKRITGYSGSINHAPEREGDIKHSLANISLAQHAFGYKVIADLAYGLEQTIAWSRQPVS